MLLIVLATMSAGKGAEGEVPVNGGKPATTNYVQIAAGMLTRHGDRRSWYRDVGRAGGAVVGAHGRAVRMQPTILVADDLQRADQPSIILWGLLSTPVRLQDKY